MKTAFAGHEARRPGAEPAFAVEAAPNGDIRPGTNSTAPKRECVSGGKGQRGPHRLRLAVEVRIEVSTKGEGQLILTGPGELADASNRRDQFRVLIADPFLVGVKKP